MSDPLRADLETMLAMNAAARVAPLTRRILDTLDGEARKLLRAVKQDERTARASFDTRLSILSIYGGEPAARDIIRQAERHRVLGRERMLEAAE